ncbi:pentapeptide repeat-containing protein [Micromonospora chalcea]|uniref:pentapeptide repeat-containing protein n=1 Tax=Micromonospora chalcea TaxID=1874 RepID=UPI003824C7BA
MGKIDRDRILYDLAISWPSLRYRYSKPLKKWLFRLAVLTLTVIGAFAYGIAFMQAPRIIDPSTLAAASPEAKLTAVHNARVLALSAGGAIVVVLGLLYTARTYKLAHRGQMTERFTKALERLGSSEMYLRVGGVRALEHVMRDSPDHHADTVEVLVSFIRDRARLHPETEKSTSANSSAEPDPDVQAALSALGQRPRRSEREPLDFSELDLRRANFRGGDFRHASFFSSNLDGAYFIDTRVAYASFMHANLGHSWFSDADIRRATFDYSACQGAFFHSARARGASFLAAILTDTNFTRSDLRGAVFILADITEMKLESADLRRAYFAEEDGTDQAIGITAQQIDQARQGPSAVTPLEAWLTRLASCVRRR